MLPTAILRSFFIIQRRPASGSLEVLISANFFCSRGMSERMLRLACKEGRFHHAGWRTRKDGSRFWAEATLTALRDAGGTVQEIAHVTRDASERRRLDAVRRKAADLAAANLVIMQAQHEAVQMLGSVTSALESPMRAIERAAARLRAPSASAKVVRAAAASLERGVAALRGELARTQDAASADGGDYELPAGSADLLHLAVDAREVLREVALAREIRVEIDVDPELGAVLVESGHTELILHNLLANAIELSREGSFVALRVLAEGPNSYRIEAEDTGLGLSPEEIERLLHGEDGPDPGRTPLGKWIAPTKGLVEQRAGRLAIKSVPGRGSVFSVVLPRKPIARAAPGAGGSGGAAERQPKVGVVLVVAEGAAARASLGWGFGSAGWDVIHAVSVEEAFGVLRAHTFEVVAVELTLSQIGAVDFVTRVRQQGLSRSVPHVMAAVHAGAVGVAGLLVADVIPQPAPADHLFAALERACVPRGRNESILIFGGDSETLSATAQTLDMLGYHPVQETDSERALRSCAKRAPSAVVLSPLPVGPDAFEFVHHLRRNSDLRQTPVLLQAPRSLDSGQVESLRKVAAQAIERGEGRIQQVLEDAGLPRAVTA
jgi:signal transduction histidine kinase/DNA-binding response OmpR family regulator